MARCLRRRAVRLAFAPCAVVLTVSAGSALAQPEPRFELSDTRVAYETVEIGLSGLPPDQPVTIRLQQHNPASLAGFMTGLWRAHATFLADEGGRVDLTRMAPQSGSYSGVSPMGLLWSAERVSTEPPPDADPWVVPAELTAEIDGTVVATATLIRRAVAADVQVSQVRDDGLVGAFYQPPGEGPHPAMLVLGGSGGGVPGTWGYPGGMSSHGYAVLSLGYFGVEGLPPEHALIPLEYFKTALDWLSEHPAVDATRIGVLGMSRGGELALLLGATYPQIATVVAQVPSHVVWSGCCGFNGPSGWSLDGEPIQQVLGVVTPEAVARHANGREPTFVHNFLALLDDEAAVARAVIPVERINGPVLLISGRDDLTWPSTYMADQVVARLRQHGFRHRVTHLAYDNAGHVIAAPPGFPTWEVGEAMGGTQEGNAWAQEQSWESILEFLEANLR